MGALYTGQVRKLVSGEQQAITARYPRVAEDGQACLNKTQPNWLIGKHWTCTRPAHHDGPHVAHQDEKALAIWGSPKRGERPQWLITSTVGLPLVEEVRRR
jgi:hypothetical protein